MNRQPTQLQYGIISNGSIKLNDSRPSNRTITGACQISITDSTDVSSQDAMTFSKRGQTGYISSKSITFLTDNYPSLSISSGVCTIDNKLQIRDGEYQTSFQQVGNKMEIMGNISSTSISGASIYGNIVIGITGIIFVNFVYLSCNGKLL